MAKNNFVGELIYTDGSPAIYSLEGIDGLSGKNGTVSKFNKPLDVTSKTRDWSDWGDDNLFPYNVDVEVRKNAIVTQGLEVLIKAHFGKGIYAYKEETTEEGKILKKIVDNPEIKTFFKSSNISRFLPQIIYDYVWFRNIFVELIFDKAGKKIALIKRHDPIHCRWEKMDKKGIIKHLFVYGDWAQLVTDDIIKIPALSYDFPLIDILNKKEDFKGGDSVVMPVRLNTGGNLYYDKTPWDSIRTGWLPIATNIPKMKDALLRNQMVIKYHVKVPYSFWERKFGNEWSDWDKTIQEKKITEWREKLDLFLRGVENAGKSFVSFYDRDEMSGKVLDEIVIEAIDDKMADKKWLTDSAAANSENLFGIGMDPTIIGQSSPGGSEGGSGSNKREAFAILQALQGLPRSITMQPLELIRDFNEWDEDIKFGFVDIDTSQTLDENPTGKKNVMN